ncbi:hypothetical protein O7627_02050 [Solwaraspora sp. WMMD1047]|uniref:hypothetical protein n=1 Tax=Solwaraspora sp. WMMD1047 TaxID=3016102 RepID=UPI002417D42F|nr:hypothetical protein [Solwaraspora sp. WMMD1047]MDG4828085.1 hypothetical protein [Solwaraspora sp. WMMD1047]
MRLTVGPLPPAVYWRRRAVVLGAALLFLIVLVYSCTGPGGSGADPGSAPTSTPTANPPESGAGGPLLTPETGPPAAGDAGEDPGGEPPAGGGPAAPPAGDATVPVIPPPAAGSCTDEEMSVVPVPSQSSIKRGATIEVRLKIRNASDRTCERDVGSQLQEVYIRIGAQVVWSSDTCSPPGESNVVTFTPGLAHEYRVAWNGKDVTRCADGVANGPVPAAGDYQVFGRLGTKRSEPVQLTLTG